MFAVDDDEDDFANVKSSKLASLFGADPSVAQDNQALVYKPEKQPKKANSATPTSTGAAPSGGQQQPAMAVIIASIVHAYTFEAGKHVSQGKLGAAIVGNHESRTYRVILYKGKQQTVATANITSTFTYTVQSNNYANFYDINRKNWSINFDNETSATECAKQIGLAKANSCGTMMRESIVQDLGIGQGADVQIGTTVNLKYTGWALEKNTFGRMFEETGTFIKVKLGEEGGCDLIKALGRALVGVASGGTRLVIVPPQSDTEGGNRNTSYPPDCVLVFLVKVGDIVTEIVAKSDKPTLPSKRLSTRLSAICGCYPAGIAILACEPSSSDETTVRARGACISEQLHQSPKTDKAKIISRMAKMGQQMLPLQGAIPTRVPSSESEAEEDQRQPHGRNTPSPHSSSPEPQPRPRGQNHTKLAHGSAAPHVQHQTHAQHATFPQLPLTYPLPGQHLLPMSAGNPYMVVPSSSYVSSPVAAAAVDSHVPFLLSEVRSQTTELRLQMGQVSEKMDRVLGKLDQSSPMSYPSMEAGMLAQHIQRIIEENEKLKGQVIEKNQKIESQTGTITELLQRNQRFLEQSNSMLEQRSSSLHTQTKLTSLEEENSKVVTKLEVLKRKLSDVTLQLEAAQTREKTLEGEVALALKSESEFHDQSDEIKRLEDALKESASRDEARKEERETLMKLQAEVEDLRCNHESKESLEIELNEWKLKCDDLRNKLAEAEATRSSPTHETSSETVANVSLAGSIKKIMNAVYRNLQTKFEGEETYTGDDVKEILASTIRAVTLELMEHFEKKDTEVQADDESETRVTKETTGGEVGKEEEETQCDKETKDFANNDDDQDWKPQPPPFGESKVDDDDWFQ